MYPKLYLTHLQFKAYCRWLLARSSEFHGPSYQYIASSYRIEIVCLYQKAYNAWEGCCEWWTSLLVITCIVRSPVLLLRRYKQWDQTFWSILYFLSKAYMYSYIQFLEVGGGVAIASLARPLLWLDYRGSGLSSSVCKRNAAITAAYSYSSVAYPW